MKLFFSTKILLLLFYISNNSNVSKETKPLDTIKIEKKRHMPYPLLIHKSEIIVQGDIIKVDKESYHFKITEKLKGKNEKNKIVIVNKWDPWACDSRRLPYKVGQKALLFLTKDTYYTINKNINKNNYNVLFGSNGEFIINKDNSIGNNFYSYPYTKDLKLETIKKGIRLSMKTITYPDKDAYRKSKLLISKKLFRSYCKQNEFYKRITRHY